jgi:CHASE3 domain sensor protein
VYGVGYNQHTNIAKILRRNLYGSYAIWGQGSMSVRASTTDKSAGATNLVDLHSLAVQIFIGTIALMVAALILMSFTLTGFENSRMQNEAAEDTLLEITTVDARLLDSDGVLAGYVISKDPWFARRIETNRSDFRAAMAKLRHSVGNDPELYQMYQGIAERLAARQEAFEYLVQHQDEVANVARSRLAQSERSLTDELRGRLWDLLHAERAKRSEQHSQMIWEAKKSFWIAVGIVVLSMIAGAISLALTRIATKVAAEQA